MVNSNSKYYSGKAPKRLDRNVTVLPHVTIQMPVYKEGLAAVIKPTVVSLKSAISTYEMQGGSANIFVNDDGMQLMSEEDAQARRDFYDEHNIGWVARPAHNPRPDVEAGETVFLRRGKFKKASNMNYALHISNRVEERLATVDRGPRWDNEKETAAYRECLEEVLQEDGGRTWAEGNIRVGDYILLIDSDTRVPSDCLLDGVSEMEQSPQVALIQFSSGVMNVTNSFFENGVTWFTRLIYSSITFSVAAGDSCPFVGHNAMLRWSAIQDAAVYTDDDGYDKFWSESHVSEDFDMSLRLQVAGYSLRYASYPGDGFKEGVSLTVYDELARWEKYAYGCNELLFHPLRFWIIRGPFTPLFKRFIFSGIPLPKKITICAYIGTYYAIAAAWSLSLANYFITGWFYGLYDKYYLDSFAIYISIIVVFTGLGNLALAVLRYRLSEQSLLGSCEFISHHPITLVSLSLPLTRMLYSIRKPQMDPHVHHLPRRHLDPRLAGHPLPLFRDRHGLGRHRQGNRRGPFRPGNHPHPAALQVDFCLLLCLHGPFGGRLLLPAVGLADRHLFQYLSVGVGGGVSFRVAGAVESRFDDVYLVDPFIEHFSLYFFYPFTGGEGKAGKTVESIATYCTFPASKTLYILNSCAGVKLRDRAIYQEPLVRGADRLGYGYYGLRLLHTGLGNYSA